MFHLHANVLTEYGLASNNHGRNEGNLVTLTKIHWRGKQHTMVSSEAIRAALRIGWQEEGLSLNRMVNYDDPENIYHYQNFNFDPELYIDDDILGYFKVEKALKNSEVNDEEISADESTKAKKNSKPKGKGIPRKGALDLNRGISSTPYDCDIVHNTFGGKKDSNSLYSSQCHSTHYEYCFSITPHHLKQPERIFHVLDGIDNLHRVGGSHSRWLYDFSPNSLVLRWTHDPCGRIFYSIDARNYGTVTAPQLLEKMKNGRLNPKEFWIGGELAEKFEMEGVHLFGNPAEAIADLQRQMRTDLGI